MSRFFETLKKYRRAIIVIVALIVALVAAMRVVPSVNAARAESSPITGIYAVNGREYSSAGEIEASDFTVYAVHENGMETPVGDGGTLSIDAGDILPTGGAYAVRITYSPGAAADEDGTPAGDAEVFECECEVVISREPVAGIKCGYPNVEDVTAVLYSNGELAFEGEGGVLAFREGEAPWLALDVDTEIVAVSFEDGVEPTDMNYWFEGLTTLLYCDEIPSTVITMIRTFSGCTGLSETAGWSGEKSLLNITECYMNCTSLETADAVPPYVKVADRAFSGCSLLLATPDMSEAFSLTNASEMFSGCGRLVSASVGPAVTDMNGMFSGCVNLKDMPEIPESVETMAQAFEGDIALQNVTSVPAGVADVSYAFSGCEIISGTLSIDADAEAAEGVFSGAALATTLNLTGNSRFLDPYANTCESGNVIVRGEDPDEDMFSVEDVIEKEEARELEEEEAALQAALEAQGAAPDG